MRKPHFRTVNLARQSFPLFMGEGFVHFVIAMFVGFIGSAVGSYLLYDRKNDAE